MASTVWNLLIMSGVVFYIQTGYGAVTKYVELTYDAKDC
jgi:hypothetical protein